MQPDASPNVNPALTDHPAQSAFDTVVAALANFRTGYRTTEFWVAIFAALMPQLLALLDKLPASTAGIITGVAALGYHLLRGTQKSSQSDTLTNVLGTLADHIASTPHEVPAPVLGGAPAAPVVVPAPVSPSSQPPVSIAIGVALAFFALFTFAGCASTAIRGGLSFSNGTEQVDVTTDGKSVRVHGGVNLDGSEVGAQVDLPLPRKSSHGLAK